MGVEGKINKADLIHSMSTLRIAYFAQISAPN